jgi:CheY-like chemotaxis protein
MKTILVVDDDPDFVEVMRLILENHYEVSTAANGKQALHSMRENKPDLVLLDVMMSYVLDGLDVTDVMSRDPELQGIPVIMVSSLPSTRYADMFPTDRYVAIDDWISKPVKPDDLLVRVAKALEQS